MCFIGWDDGANVSYLHFLFSFQSRAPQSLIITVGTHLDQLSPKSGFREQTVETLREIIQEKFPDLHDNLIEVEALDRNSVGIQDLKQLIYDCALEMKFRQEHGPIKGTEQLVGRMVIITILILNRLKSRSNIRNEWHLYFTDTYFKDLSKQLPHSIISCQNIDKWNQFEN